MSADEFAIALDELLEQREISPEDLAGDRRMAAARVTAAAVQEWRDGIRFPCPRHLQLLLEVLEVPRSRLLP